MKISTAFVLVVTGWLEYCLAAFGGHDLYSSLAQLLEVWRHELVLVDRMQEMIHKMEGSEEAANVTRRLQEYVRSHHSNQLDQEPNYEYLSHPLDAYHFVRHISSKWERLRQEPLVWNAELRNSSVFNDDIEALVDWEVQHAMPAMRDAEGAAFGIIRLWCLYKFNETEFIQDGIISAELGNGQVVRSRPSVIKVNSFDLAMFANQGQENSLHDAATTFIDAAASMAEAEESLGISMEEFYGFAMSSKQLAALGAQMKKVHDHKLDKLGGAGIYMRTHGLPFDLKLRKKKKFKEAKQFVPKLKVYDRETVLLHDKVWLVEDEKNKTLFNQAGAWQGDELCRGKQLKTPKEMSNLTCYYAHNGSPWLRLGPMRVEINSYDPYHMTIRNLMFEHECDKITEFLGPLLDFPPGRMDRGKVKNDWTMKNCWPKESDNIYLDKMNRRIEYLTRLNANANKHFSEPFMCGNYGIGGHYFIHPDYNDPQKENQYEPGHPGNRVATIMTVLQSPEAGGATVWPYARISVFPEKGSAIYWRNTFTDNTSDVFTRHKACPVLYGQKWIGNKWVGYNAQWNKQNCKIQPETPFDPVLN